MSNKNNGRVTVFGTTFIGVSKNVAEKLKRLEDMAVTRGQTPMPFTVGGYIEQHPDAVIGKRTSKKGVNLITVQYPNGVQKQYEEDRIWNTNVYDEV